MNLIKKSPFEVTATITRPGDTTAYANGDAITDSTSAPTAITFSNAGEGEGIVPIEFLEIHEVVLKSDAGGANLSWALWLFHTIPTATNDNSALAVSDADNANLKAVILSGTAQSHNVSANQISQYVGEPRIISLAGSNSVNLFGLLQAKAAYTPANAEVFTIEIRGYRVGGQM